jgi:hypothetical protein
MSQEDYESLLERSLVGYTMLIYPVDEIKQIQRWWRAIRARRAFQRALMKIRYLQHLIVRIQRWWRRRSKRGERRAVIKRRSVDFADIKAALFAARCRLAVRE